MSYILIGKVVGTHGIKGEVKIRSDFSLKNEIFIKGKTLYLGPEKAAVLINSYRYHKIYDMVTLDGYNNINDVLEFKGKNVFALKEDLNNNDYILEDLIGFIVIENNQEIGQVQDIIKNKANTLLQVNGNKSFYIPFCDEYVKKIDSNNKEIIVKNVEGLML